MERATAHTQISQTHIYMHTGIYILKYSCTHTHTQLGASFEYLDADSFSRRASHLLLSHPHPFSGSWWEFGASHLNWTLPSLGNFHPACCCFFFNFTHMSVHIHVCYVHAWGSQRLEESDGCPGSGITTGHSCVWMLGIKPGSAWRVASAFNRKAIISSPGLLYFHYIVCHYALLSTTYHLSNLPEVWALWDPAPWLPHSVL